MKLKYSQVIIAVLVSAAIGGYALFSLLFKTDLFSDPLPAAKRSIANDLKGWKPGFISKPIEEPPAFFTVDFSRLIKDFNPEELRAATKQEKGFSVLTGKFKSQSSERITEPFDGVIVRLTPEQAPYKGQDLKVAGLEVFWVVPISGNANGEFRQSIADNPIEVDFQPNNCAAIVDWSAPGANRPGTITVVSLRTKHFNVANRIFDFDLNDPKTQAIESERAEIKQKFADYTKELGSASPPSPSRVNEIQADVNRLTARKQELDAQEQRDSQ